MGWTCFAKPADVKAELDCNLTWEDATASHRVLRGAFVGLTYYTANERIDKATGERTVWAGVTLIRYHPTRWAGGVEMCVKEMDEGCGPCEATCPLSILALLTEPEGGRYAAEWRVRCYAYHAARTRPVSDEEVSAWAASKGARFSAMSKPYHRKWRNAYRRHHPVAVALPPSVASPGR